MIAVSSRSTSTSLKSKFGIRSLSSGCSTRPLSKMRGSWSFVRNHAIFDVCGMSVMNAKSSRVTSLLPSSDRSVPIDCAFSNPLMSWQLKQPYRTDHPLPERDLLLPGSSLAISAFASSNGMTPCSSRGALSTSLV